MKVEIVRCKIRPAHVVNGLATVADLIEAVGAAVADADGRHTLSVETVPYEVGRVDDGVTIVWTFDDEAAE